METFYSFLRSRSITPLPSPTSGVETLESVVATNFDSLREQDLREIAGEAIKARDSNAAKGLPKDQLLGEWALILDAVHTETSRRQERAQFNMRQLIECAHMGKLKLLNKLIAKLLPEIDMLLMDIITATLADRMQHKDEENVNMLTYIKKEIFRQRIALAKGVEDLKISGDDDEEEEDDGPDEETLQYEREMMQAGELLKAMLSESAGDVSKLAVLANRYVAENKIGDAFVQVLSDNISACEAAKYVNKLKVLNFLKSVVTRELDAVKVQLGNTTYHAPQFTGDRFRDDGSGGGIELVFEASEFIESGSMTEALLKASGPKTKKKGLRSVTRKKLEQLAATAASHLDEHKWAVCDHFLPLDLVRRVRIEAELFRDQYEEAEIWVGKESDTGAMLSVPSVRGDRVLWMCGGHVTQRAVEGMSRVVRTQGEIEPCRLDIKQHAPIRKFHGLAELMAAIDKFVYELKNYSPALSGVYERSDAMMAIYPGGGARFANHIDNTTRDGRRLTVLIYLNPDWDPANGGALRVTMPHEKTLDGSGGAANPKNVVGVSPAELSAQAAASERASEEAPLLAPAEDGVAALGAEPLEVTIMPPASPVQSASAVYSAVDIYPNAGRLAMFFSSEVPHEVLPTFADRHSLTLWYYDTSERKEAVEEAKRSGRAEKAANTSVESQKGAKQFMEVLMGKDEDGHASETELADLCERVKRLSDETADIVASITGAPSVDSFRAGFELLTTEDLVSMRKLFRRMGLK